jgi:hypothetical protein
MLERRLVNSGEVSCRSTSWLWLDRIPRGGITGLDGDPGQAKSTIWRHGSRWCWILPDDPDLLRPFRERDLNELVDRLTCGDDGPPPAGGNSEKDDRGRRKQHRNDGDGGEEYSVD